MVKTGKAKTGKSPIKEEKKPKIQKKANKENEQEEKKVSRSKSKEPKRKNKKDETESEEEEIKTNTSAISEKFFLTWKKDSKAKGGKKAFIDDFVKKARD